MTIEDYDQVYALWKKIKGFGIRSIDDSREGVARFLKRNPSTSVVAEEDGKIVGSILLCGHDGRRGCLYHVCVDEACRRHGIGRAMVVFCHEGASERGNQQSVSDCLYQKRYRKCFLEIPSDGQRDWDLNYYDFTLNEENITAFNEQ